MSKKLMLICLTILFAVISNLASAESKHKYVGVKKCSMCHRSESKGNQYEHWQSSKHSKAYQTLATPEAASTAKKAGVSGNPKDSPQCLKCHVTGYGEDSSLFEQGFVKEDGVQCESCHGAGADYATLEIMKDKAKAIGAGLIMPTKEVCVKCHNEESPEFKEFNFEEFFKKIAHPRPKE